MSIQASNQLSANIQLQLRIHPVIAVNIRTERGVSLHLQPITWHASPTEDVPLSLIIIYLLFILVYNYTRELATARADSDKL